MVDTVICNLVSFRQDYINLSCFKAKIKVNITYIIIYYIYCSCGACTFTMQWILKVTGAFTFELMFILVMTTDVNCTCLKEQFKIWGNTLVSLF